MTELVVRIDNRVRVYGLENAPAAAIAELKAAFTYDNPKFHELRRMGLPMWKEPRRIATWKAEIDHASFPRGRAKVVGKILRDAGVDMRVTDARVIGTGKGKIPKHSIELYEHQHRIVSVAEELEQCIILCATGGGKTTGLLALACKLGIATIVIAPNKGIMRQWQERASRELGLKAKDIGVYQGANRRLKMVTIALQHTLRSKIANDREALNFFGLVAADEVHLAAADTYYQSVDLFPAKYRVGTSDDWRRKDKKEFLIADIFGPVGTEISYQELVALGVIMDVEVRLVPTDQRADWYGMPSDGEEDKQVDFGRLVKELAPDEQRIEKCLAIVADEVPFGPVMVLTHEREHCQMLFDRLVARGFRTGLLLGGDDDEEEFEIVKNGLITGKLDVGVATYKAGGTGIDIPQIVAAIAYTPIGGNETTVRQVRGRVCRATPKHPKAHARLYVFWDRNIYPTHKTNLARWNSRIFIESGTKWREC